MKVATIIKISVIMNAPLPFSPLGVEPAQYEQGDLWLGKLSRCTSALCRFNSTTSLFVAHTTQPPKMIQTRVLWETRSTLLVVRPLVSRWPS